MSFSTNFLPVKDASQGRGCKSSRNVHTLPRSIPELCDKVTPQTTPKSLVFTSERQIGQWHVSLRVANFGIRPDVLKA
jgi:hypothetical protein